MRVEEFAARAGVSVDTVRYYQAKGLLPPPRREGRVAWYGGGHLDRIARIRSLQSRGFTLATIVRVVNGELDAADEALVEELSGTHDPRSGRRRATPAPEVGTGPDPVGAAGGEELLTLEELAVRTGVPLPLLRAVEAEGLLVPRRVGVLRPLHDRGRRRRPGRAGAPRVGRPPLGPPRPGPAAPPGDRRGGPGGRRALLRPRSGSPTARATPPPGSDGDSRGHEHP